MLLLSISLVATGLALALPVIRWTRSVGLTG